MSKQLEEIRTCLFSASQGQHCEVYPDDHWDALQWARYTEEKVVEVSAFVEELYSGTDMEDLAGAYGDFYDVLLGVVSDLQDAREALKKIKSDASVQHRIKNMAREGLGEDVEE